MNHVHFIKPIRNQRGISLIEIIVSVGIAGIIMISMLSMMQLMNKNSSNIAFNVTKNEVISKIRLNALSLASVETSAALTQTLGSSGMTPNVGSANSFPYSAMLANCMPGLATAATCDKTTMDDARGFKFYLANGSSADPTQAIAGEDIYYTTKGVRCTSEQAASPVECPLMTSVWAEPYCNGVNTTCSKAVSLTIRYRVEIRPDYSGETFMAPLEGEIYLALSKGIHLSRLLSQSDVPIPLNANGIYSVQKYYGLPDQASLPTGLRFEAILGNPIGLVSMKLQVRSITGTDAVSYLDDVVPADMKDQTWTDVRDPLDPNTSWIVQLTGAKPNQIINFGTQTTATASYNTTKSYGIGASATDTAANQAKFRWTINATGALVAPTFKSGFYQFRIVALDTAGATTESMNYITVRIIPRPQFLMPATQPSFTQIRNCIGGQKIVNYQLAVADDEFVGLQTFKLNGVDVGFSQVTGTNGFIQIPFDLSQNIAGVNQAFGYAYTVKNKFTGRTINSVVMPETNGNFSVTLSEKPVSAVTLSAYPSKIRINTTGTISANIETGSCCSEDPTLSWTYPTVPEVSAPLLSGNPTSTPVCTIDTADNRRICSGNVTATGIKESPSITSSPDIIAQYTFATPSTACTGGTINTSYTNNTYVPVVKIPGIQFYLTESLWLDLPNNPIRALKTISPAVYVRSDFQPDQDVTVGVYKSTDGSLVCSITFEAGTGANPIDRICSIPVGYSGDLILNRISPNVMIDTDAFGPSFRAKLVSGKLNHRTCQASLTSIPDFAPYTVSTNQPMLNSPWGFTTDAFGNAVQDTYNDAGHWAAGNTKQLRCYDSWNGTIGASSYSNTDNMNITGYGVVDINIQDIYRLYRYNSEIKPPAAANVHNSIGNASVTSSKARYQTYIFPDNPNLDFDPKNAPYVFAVYHNGGAPSQAVWQFVNPLTEATGTTPPKPWTDYTPQLCSGSSALSRIRLFGVKTVGHSTAETVMKATNNIYASGSSYYSYSFMCAFGRWNPFVKTSTTWSN